MRCCQRKNDGQEFWWPNNCCLWANKRKSAFLQRLQLQANSQLEQCIKKELLFNFLQQVCAVLQMLKWPQGELNKKAMEMGKEEGFEKELEE
jgi:hypothetical protein